ncbi:MAG: hypothetical protein ACP5OB_07395 [Candidatus Ratteibacteria bacterium]
MLIFTLNIYAKEKNSIILKKNIFTAPPPPPKIETQSILKPEPLPSLDTLIEICGIVYFPYGVSFAVIKDKKTNIEEIYKEGDVIGNAKILKIEINKVIFDYDNKKISLNFENKIEQKAFIISKDTIQKNEENEKRDENVIVPKFPEKVISMDVNFNETITNLTNDRKLIENVNIIPNVSEGGIIGFKVENLPENSIPYQYGLRNGDIIRRVNGILIDSIATGFNVYNQIKKSNVDIVTVEVIRNNQPLLLTYRLNRKSQ